MGVEASIGL